MAKTMIYVEATGEGLVRTGIRWRITETKPPYKLCYAVGKKSLGYIGTATTDVAIFEPTTEVLMWLQENVPGRFSIIQANDLVLTGSWVPVDHNRSLYSFHGIAIYVATENDALLFKMKFE